MAKRNGGCEAQRACRRLSAARPPVPGQQLSDAINRVIGDASEHVASECTDQIALREVFARAIAMYAFGHGVPGDIVRAHMWLDLSAARAAQIEGAQKLARDAQELRDTLSRKMTPAQIAEAQHLAREWKPKSER